MSDAPEQPVDALDELIAAELTARATPEVSAQLAALLRSDAAALHRYVRAGFLHAQLRQTLSATSELGTRNAERPLSLKPDLSPRWAPRAKVRVPNSKIVIRHSKFAAAALLLAAAAIAIYVFAFAFAFNSKPETRDPRLEAPVATVIESTGTLLFGDRVASPGDDLGVGEVSLDSGSAEFRLANGVGVTLRGDTALTVHHPMHATLTRGAASFDCPPAAKGFTVHLPDRSRIVDLGTAFRVEVDDTGEAVLRVTQGRVAWSPATPEAEPVIVDAGFTARMRDGRPVAWIDHHIVTPDHIVSGAAIGQLIAIDPPLLDADQATSDGGADNSSKGFRIVSGVGGSDAGRTRAFWEPDGTDDSSMQWNGAFLRRGEASFTFDLPDGAVVHGVYACWNPQRNLSAEVSYSHDEAADAPVMRSHLLAPKPDLALRWTAADQDAHVARFERLFDGPIVVTGGDGFAITLTTPGIASIDAVVIDVSLPGRDKPESQTITGGNVPPPTPHKAGEPPASHVPTP